MPKTEHFGHAGLTGWRETLADRVASPVAGKTPASEDQVRAIVGATFFLLSAVLRRHHASRGWRRPRATRASDSHGATPPNVNGWLGRVAGRRVLASVAAGG